MISYLEMVIRKLDNHSKKDYIEIEFIPKLSKKSFIRYLIREVSGGWNFGKH
jgi:hypothetical protein